MQKKKLKKISIDGITYKLKYPYAFVEYADLDIEQAYIRAIVYDCLVVEINHGAFRDCKNLKSVEIEAIDDEYFSMVGDATFEIGDFAFSRCESLTEISIPNYFKSFGESAFECCNNLKTINFTGNVVIGDGCFSCCSSLEKVLFKCNIPDYCFLGCNSLKEMIISDNATEIGSSAFRDCKNLEYVFIPKSVKIIKEMVFKSDYNLKKVVFEAPEDWILEREYGEELEQKTSFLNPEENAKGFMREDRIDAIKHFKKWY